MRPKTYCSVVEERRLGSVIEFDAAMHRVSLGWRVAVVKRYADRILDAAEAAGWTLTAERFGKAGSRLTRMLDLRRGVDTLTIRVGDDLPAEPLTADGRVMLCLPGLRGSLDGVVRYLCKPYTSVIALGGAA